MEEVSASPENVWVWREDTESLVCVAKQDADLLREYWSGQCVSARPLRSNHYDRTLFRSINNFNKLQEKLLQNPPLPLYRGAVGDKSQVSTVGLSNIKQVAVEYISEKHLASMLMGAVVKFDTCLSLCCFDKLLLCCIRYFHNSLRLRQYSDVGDNAYKYLDSSSKDWEERVLTTEADLHRMSSAIARVYSSLLLCVELDGSLHHSNHGKRKTSKSQIDNQFYEAVYDYLLFGVWVTFSRQHWEEIKSSIGALFKAPFTVCLERRPDPSHHGQPASVGFARVGREFKSLSLSVSKHKYTRSILSKSVSPAETATGTESELEDLVRLTDNVGIIGSNLALFDPISLEPIPDRLRLSTASFARSSS